MSVCGSSLNPKFRVGQSLLRHATLRPGRNVAAVADWPRRRAFMRLSSSKKGGWVLGFIGLGANIKGTPGHPTAKSRCKLYTLGPRRAIICESHF